MERYSIQKVIGEGSFGRAILVQDDNSREMYVLKQIHLSKNQTKLERSRRESVLLSRMKHSNIVAFREAFEDDGHLCIVMEYCSGGDLLQRIRHQKTSMFSVNDILKWFAEMCAGTKHIHDKRVLHRDLKSKNIFLTHDGSVKLGDFGSACILNSSKAHAYSYVGTPYYVSPEIWDNKPYNNKSDVWSLGCVLYELCTLRHPVFPLNCPYATSTLLVLASYCTFQASSWKTLILKVCRGAYPPLPSHLPYELHYLIKQMFKTNPRDRPSLHTILTSHRISKLLHGHISLGTSQAGVEAGERDGRRTGRWRKQEGEKVASLLGETSLIATSTFEGMERHESHKETSRKQWAVPSDTVAQLLANASILSDSMLSTGQTHTGDQKPVGLQESRPRRQWDKNPPERIMSLLEKADLSTAFKTYSINRDGDNPLLGPLFQAQGDDTDGPEEEVLVDKDRLEARSDDDDTDFEEESPYNWVDELEKRILHS